MRPLREGLNLAHFYKSLNNAQHRVLMLDYDGTLAPFRTERDQAIPYPGVREALMEIIAAGRTRLIIISGRAIRDLTPLLDLTILPEIWGSHGVERLTCDGRYRVASQDEKPAEGLAEVYWWARNEGLLARTERKPSGIAFHWRDMNRQETDALRQKLQSKWQGYIEKFGLVLHEFDGGLELRVAGITKGDVVRIIISESAADTIMAYLGDDATDEDAFSALRGHGLSVLVRVSLRESAADLWIRPPDELLEFLKRWINDATC